MVYYDCEVKAVLGQAHIYLKSTEERDNIVGICIITEVSLSRLPVDFPSRSLKKQVNMNACVRCANCWKCFFRSNSLLWYGVD